MLCFIGAVLVTAATALGLDGCNGGWMAKATPTACECSTS